ncbi:hypothetical protein GWI33_000810 [Rhynchophorus ferrugineus]|uniref:Uncharacterized protein n=1 Tax=Rhynchophorus ferrugineus TaxID=354439 RepID=A0A834LXM5_RHYFE|nr:hypothetical protein GWI33_000810 [Rhynchophorus ferrugineus]
MCLKACVILAAATICVVLAAPSPGYLEEYHALPAATSYSSRVDIHGPEYVKTYAAAPVVAKTFVTSPVVKTVPQPLISGYSSYGYGLGHDYGVGYGYEHDLGYGYDLEHHY